MEDFLCTRLVVELTSGLVRSRQVVPKRCRLPYDCVPQHDGLGWIDRGLNGRRFDEHGSSAAPDAPVRNGRCAEEARRKEEEEEEEEEEHVELRVEAARSSSTLMPVVLLQPRSRRGAVHVLPLSRLLSVHPRGTFSF